MIPVCTSGRSLSCGKHRAGRIKLGRHVGESSCERLLRLGLPIYSLAHSRSGRRDGGVRPAWTTLSAAYPTTSLRCFPGAAGNSVDGPAVRRNLGGLRRMPYGPAHQANGRAPADRGRAEDDPGRRAGAAPKPDMRRILFQFRLLRYLHGLIQRRHLSIGILHHHAHPTRPGGRGEARRGVIPWPSGAPRCHLSTPDPSRLPWLPPFFRRHPAALR